MCSVPGDRLECLQTSLNSNKDRKQNIYSRERNLSRAQTEQTLWLTISLDAVCEGQNQTESQSVTKGRRRVLIG